MNLKTISVVIFCSFLIHCYHKPVSEPLSETRQWHHLGNSKNGSVFYYDPQTIGYPSESLVTVWIKVLPCEAESIYRFLSVLVNEGLTPMTEDILKTKEIVYSLILYEVNCTEQTIVSLCSEDFDEQGHTLFCDTNEKDVIVCFKEFKSLDLTINPDTIWSTLFDVACKALHPDKRCG